MAPSFAFLQRARHSVWHPPAAKVAPTKPMAQRLRRELSTGRSECGVLLSTHGYRTKIGQLKAYRDSIPERYRAEQQKHLDQAELAYGLLLRASFRPEADVAGDPVHLAIRDRPATDWLEAQVSDWLARRDPAERDRSFDPVCEKITHYRRLGKHARYTFKCYLRSHKSARSPTACFWVKYLDLDNLPSARGLLAKYGWRMCDHFREYSEGESAWSDNMPSSCNEAHLPPERRMRARKGCRGSEHPLVKKRMKR